MQKAYMTQKSKQLFRYQQCYSGERRRVRLRPQRKIVLKKVFSFFYTYLCWYFMHQTGIIFLHHGHRVTYLALHNGRNMLKHIFSSFMFHWVLCNSCQCLTLSRVLWNLRCLLVPLWKHVGPGFSSVNKVFVFFSCYSLLKTWNVNFQERICICLQAIFVFGIFLGPLA